MSQENVEIVRRFIEAFNERDLDAALRDFDPDGEVDWSRSRGVDLVGIYRGYDATRNFCGTLLDIFVGITLAADEFIESGDHVVVPNRARFVGRDGIEVAVRSAMVVAVRDGRIVRWSLFQEKVDALEAVGLRK